MKEIRSMPNNGQYHLFLGDSLSSGIDKTVVEPGNAFSPGMWTVGVSVAIKSESVVSPETCTLPLRFENNKPPVTVSEYDVGKNVRVRSKLCHLGGTGWQGVDYLHVSIDGDPEEACLIVRDIGPAGGKITSIVWEQNALIVNGDMRFEFESALARVDILPADDMFDSPAAFVFFEKELLVRALHGYGKRAFSAPLPFRPVYAVEEGFAVARKRWEESLPARVFAPDRRIAEMWEQSAYHLIAAMECGLPRISVNNYPIFWIRDCVIVLRAMDYLGRHDLARTGCDYLAPIVFSGGFGSESDNPGEGIWALVTHAQMTGDIIWLRGIFPAIIDRVKWIQRMLTATENIYRPADMRTVWAHYWPGSDLVCMPHVGGHIHGRMDGHSPDFYINCWAYIGLALAAEAARTLGEDDLADAWKREARDLDREIYEELLPCFGNERDSCVVPYPCGALSGHESELREAFAAWYDAHRLNEAGNRIPEPLWTYFEAAQIHNAILLGMRERAWACLDGFLSDPRWKDMSLFIEGSWGATEMLPFGTGKYGRGWLQQGATGANMPHNWTAAEVINLLRSLFVVEKDGHLELLKGVPDTWMAPGACFGVEKMPTRYGIISFTATVGSDNKISLEFSEGEDIPHIISR